MTIALFNILHLGMEFTLNNFLLKGLVNMTMHELHLIQCLKTIPSYGKMLLYKLHLDFK